MSRSPRTTAFPAPEHDHAPCLADTIARAESAFRTRGMKMTPLRRTVLEDIAASHSAVGAYDILDRLSRKGPRRLAPISVYRALDSLVAAGVVHRLESRNAFFACHTAHPIGRRQIVLACERCSTVAELSEPQVFEGIAATAASSGFVPSEVLVEVTGTCRSCHAAGG